MDIATGTWFKYLRESAKSKKKEVVTEISRREARDLYDWMAQEGDRINPEFDELFNGSMRVAFPLGTGEERNLSQLVSALKELGWQPASLRPGKFPIRNVKQKYRGEGGVEQEREMEVAKLDLHRTYKFTIPAGPRKGETIDKTRTTTMSRAIANLRKSELITQELADWWAKKQTYYTKEDEWGQIEDMFAGTHETGTTSVIISRHPMDVLRMSDIGNISSCHREGTEYFKCAIAESRGAGLIAYLVKTQKLEEFLRTGFKDAEAPPTDKVDRFLNWFLMLPRPSLGAKEHTIGTYLQYLIDEGAPDANVTIAFKRMMRTYTTDSEKVAEKGGQPVWQYDNPLMKNMRSSQNLVQRMREKLPELAEMPQTDDQTTYQAQLAVRTNILETPKGFENEPLLATILQRHLNDADMFEEQLEYMMNSSRWNSVPHDVKRAVTPDMVREAIHAHLDKKPWPPLDQVPTPRPIGDFDKMEIFRDFNRNIPGIVADARVRLRKFFDSASGDYFAVPEERTYGRSSPGFANTVGEWAWDNQKYLFMEEGEDHLELPRESYLIRYGGSYEDTEDGFILNDFFSRSGTKVTSYHGNVTHEHEEGDNIWDQYEEQVDDLLTQAQNRSEHMSFQAEVAGDEQPYVWGRADIRFTFPLGWTGESEHDDGYHRFPAEKREYTPIPSGYADSDYKDRRAFVQFIDDSVDIYSEDTNWEVYGPLRGEGQDELRIDMTFNCDDCNDPDSLDSFIDYTISDIDDKFDELYEKMRRALVEGNYIAPSDFDRMFDDMREANEELKHWRAAGLDEGDDYDGEIWFWFEPEGKGKLDTPFAVLPKVIGNTIWSLEKTIPSSGVHANSGNLYPGPTFIRKFSAQLIALQEAANGYAKEQLELDFGEEYERPTFEGVKFSENANLGFALDSNNTVRMILKIIIEASDSREEIEGAMAFMRYIDEFPDMIIDAARTTLNEYIEEKEAKMERRDREYLDGTKFAVLYRSIDAKYGVQADGGDPHAEAAMLAAMWVRDNWEHMGKAEKYTAIDKILRPLSVGALHPRHVWSNEEDQPEGWVGMVQATMRGMGMPTSVHWGYKGIQTRSRKPEASEEPTDEPAEKHYVSDDVAPDLMRDRMGLSPAEAEGANLILYGPTLSDEDRFKAMGALVSGDKEEFMRIISAGGTARLRGRLGPPQPAQESVEAQIDRVEKMLGEVETRSGREPIDLRIYKVNLGCVVDLDTAGTDSQIENQIRGIEEVTTVRHISDFQKAIGTRQVFRVYEVKFELYGQQARDTYRDSLLVPGVTREVKGVKVVERGQVQDVVNPLREWGGLGRGYGMMFRPSPEMITPSLSLDAVLEDWVDGAVQIYDVPMNTNQMQYHVMMPVSELWKHASRYYRGSKTDFDGRYKYFIKDGAQMPVYVALGQNGRIKITGNEDLVWFAKKAGLEELPVFFSYQKQV